MGLLDVIKGLFSDSPSQSSRYAPPPPPAAEVIAAARAAWEKAVASGDYMEGQSAAYDLSDKAWLHDEAVAAYRALFEKHQAERGSIATMIGQTLYLGKAGYKVTLQDPEKAAVYADALGWYVRAAELGDRSQALNYVEMCEWLSKKPALKQHARPFIDSFDKNFPNSEYRARITALRN
jgi:hypothetical protein